MVYKHCKDSSVTADNSSNKRSVYWRLLAVAFVLCLLLYFITLVCNYLKHFSLLGFLLLAQIFFLVLHSIRLNLLCSHWSVKFLLTSYWLSATRVTFLSKRQLTVNPILSLSYFHPNICNLFFRICTQLLYFLFLWALAWLFGNQHLQSILTTFHSGNSLCQKNNSYSAFCFTSGCHQDTMIFHRLSQCIWWIVTRVSLS